MKRKELPVIDWEHSLRLASNKKDLAEDMFSLLMKHLSSDISSIQECYRKENYTELLKRVHKLHGALCYCSLPRLKAVISLLESDLKNNIIMNLPSLIRQLDIETNLIFEHHSRIDASI